MFKIKPIIGITGHFEKSNNKYYVDQRYIDAVNVGGGIPLIIPIYSNASRFLDIINGLIISGGGITPLSEKELKSKFLPSLEEQNPIRYEFESFLIRECYDKNIPMMGICRGHQMIAEVLGGKVSRENPLLDKQKVVHCQKVKDDKPSHDIKLISGSCLKRLLNKNKIKVNSLHRQGVEIIPEGFRISAIADDGVIEGMESENCSVMCFQFHPEMLLSDDHKFKKIFTHFVRRCRKKQRILRL